MNSIAFDHRGSIPISFGYMSKINPFNQNRNSGPLNKGSMTKRYCPCYTHREFGKEINISSNLTTITNRDSINKRKIAGIPVDLKQKKENKNNKNYQQIAIRRSRRDYYNSLNIKINNSIGKNDTIRNSKEKIKKENKKIKNKNMSQKNERNKIHNISVNDDIIMTNENSIPNIITKNYTSQRTIIFDNLSHCNMQVNYQIKNEDVEMKIENANRLDIKVKKENIQNVDEYFDDICTELLKNEDKYLVDPQYMLKQTDINHRMRAILIDWLIDVHLKYKLVPQTMYICVNLIDRYLSKNEINRVKLQLVGVTAMFIACKYEEIYPPELKDFVYITDGAYVKEDVLNMEYKMLKDLNFNVTFPTQWSIFEIYKKKLDLNEKTFKLAWFLMELCLMDIKVLKFKMSVLAASAILLASRILGVYRSNWLGKTIGIEEKSLEECCKEIYDFNIYNSTHNLQAIRRKFSSSKFDEVAKIKIF